MRLEADALRALAREYRETVRAVIGEENFATVLDEYKNCEDGTNFLRIDGGWCRIGHEHGFCDANMVVYEIWERHFGAVDEMDQEYLDQLSSIMNTAFPCKHRGRTID